MPVLAVALVIQRSGPDASARQGGAMWKWTPKDGNQPVESFYPGVTYIGKSIAIKGEVSGTENVDVAGDLEGSVELLEGSLTLIMVRITPQADRGAAPTAQGSLISLFSLSKQKLLGKVLKGISCSALLRFKEDASQAAARKG